MALLLFLFHGHLLHPLSFCSFRWTAYFTSVCSFSHWHNVIFRYLIIDLTQATSLDATDFTLVINLSLVLQMKHFIIIFFFYCENQKGLLPFL
jgi:hypothetical protein